MQRLHLGNNKQYILIGSRSIDNSTGCMAVGRECEPEDIGGLEFNTTRCWGCLCSLNSLNNPEKKLCLKYTLAQLSSVQM